MSHVTEFTAWLTDCSTAMPRNRSTDQSQSAFARAAVFCSGTALRTSEYTQ